MTTAPCMPRLWRQDWAETAQTFVDAAKDVQKSVSNETVLVVVTYFDAAGVELASQSFSSAD